MFLDSVSRLPTCLVEQQPALGLFVAILRDCSLSDVPRANQLSQTGAVNSLSCTVHHLLTPATRDDQGLIDILLGLHPHVVVAAARAPVARDTLVSVPGHPSRNTRPLGLRPTRYGHHAYSSHRLAFLNTTADISLVLSAHHISIRRSRTAFDCVASRFPASLELL